VTGVPDQQHGERAVRGRETGHLGGTAPRRTVGHPDGTRRVPEPLRSRPPERPGHINRATVRHYHVQLPGVEQNAVPTGVQKLTEPRGHGQRYVVLHPLVNHVH